MAAFNSMIGGLMSSIEYRIIAVNKKGGFTDLAPISPASALQRDEQAFIDLLESMLEAARKSFRKKDIIILKAVQADFFGSCTQGGE